MAKIRTLKRKLSIIRKQELREIRKEKQGRKHKNNIEKCKFYANRIYYLIFFKKTQRKLSTIINQKT